MNFPPFIWVIIAIILILVLLLLLGIHVHVGAILAAAFAGSWS